MKLSFIIRFKHCEARFIMIKIYKYLFIYSLMYFNYINPICSMPTIKLNFYKNMIVDVLNKV